MRLRSGRETLCSPPVYRDRSVPRTTAPSVAFRGNDSEPPSLPPDAMVIVRSITSCPVRATVHGVDGAWSNDEKHPPQNAQARLIDAVSSELTEEDVEVFRRVINSYGNDSLPVYLIRTYHRHGLVWGTLLSIGACIAFISYLILQGTTYLYRNVKAPQL